MNFIHSLLFSFALLSAGLAHAQNLGLPDVPKGCDATTASKRLELENKAYLMMDSSDNSCFGFDASFQPGKECNILSRYIQSIKYANIACNAATQAARCAYNDESIKQAISDNAKKCSPIGELSSDGDPAAKPANSTASTWYDYCGAIRLNYNIWREYKETFCK